MFFSQNPIWVGDVVNGGYMGSTGPYGYYNYSRTQHIYKSSEIVAGEINSVAIYVGAFSPGGKNGTIDNVSVKMTHVTYNEFASPSYEETGLETVWTGTIDPNAAEGWVRIEFTTPFDYNGTDNLLLELRSEDGSYSNNCEPLWAYTPETTTGETNKTLKGYSDTQNPPTNQFLSTYRADVVFGYSQDNMVTSSKQIGTNDASYVKSVVANGYYNYSHVQHIYLASELQTGTIDQLSFYVGTYFDDIDFGTIENVDIKLGHTTDNSFASATYAGSLTQVWNGTIAPNELGWFTITLDTAFTYDGTDNLVIDIYSNDGDWTENCAPDFAYTVQGDYKTIKDYTDVLPLNTAFRSTQRADIVFGFESDIEIAEEIQIGTQEAKNQFNVVDGYYNYSKMQYIYKSSELQAGDISRVAFYIGSYFQDADYGDIDNVTIRMSHIVDDTISTAAFIVDPLFDTVWTGSLLTFDRGWHYIDLDSTFSYNGTDNLIIEFFSEDGSWIGNSIPEFSYTTQSLPEKYKAVKDYDDVQPFSQVYRSAQRADLKIGYTQSEIVITKVDVIDGQLGTINIVLGGGVAPYQVHWNEDNYQTETDFNITKSSKSAFITEIGLNPSILDGFTYTNFQEKFNQTQLTNVKPGKHRIYITDSEGTKEIKEVEINVNLSIANNNGLDVTNNVVSKLTGVDDWNTSIKSANTVGYDENGFLKLKIENLTSHLAIGLEATDADTGTMPYDLITYGFFLENNLLKIIESGVYAEISTIQLSINDEISIEKKGEEIIYRRNGATIRTISGAKKSYNLKANLNKSGSKIDIQHMLGTIRPVLSYAATNLDCGDINTGSIDLTVNSWFSISSYIWKDANGTTIATTEDVSGLAPGKYTVTVINSLGISSSKEVWVGYKTIWKEKQNVVSLLPPNDNSLQKTNSTLGTANSINELETTTPGWQRFGYQDLNSSSYNDNMSIYFSNESMTKKGWMVILNWNFFLNLAFMIEDDGTNPPYLVGVSTLPSSANFNIERETNGLITYTRENTLNSNSSSSNEVNFPGLFDFSSEIFYSNVEISDHPGSQLNNHITSFNCPPLVTYTELKHQLDGSYYSPRNNKVKFLYLIRYKQEQNQSLVYNIYNEQRGLVANRDKDGSTTIPLSPNQLIAYGQNICELDIVDLNLSVGTYTLEVISPKKDKTYLKFVVD